MISFRVLGNLPRKSNGRQIFRPGGRKLIFAKSNKALAYEKSFILQTGYIQKGTFADKQQLKMTAYIYYDSQRPDLSDELLCDLMEKSGIIPNDRYIFEKHIYKIIDRKCPRVEVDIEAISEGTKPLE
jgi:Holliday junction resolvase RusA-like endonuclease